MFPVKMYGGTFYKTSKFNIVYVNLKVNFWCCVPVIGDFTSNHLKYFKVL